MSESRSARSVNKGKTAEDPPYPEKRNAIERQNP
jgi:hypothetical protein